MTERNCSLWIRKKPIKRKSGRKKVVKEKWQRKGKGGNISAPNRWRGGDRQMKISCSVGSVEWQREGNRMTEGEMGGEVMYVSFASKNEWKCTACR